MPHEAPRSPIKAARESRQRKPGDDKMTSAVPPIPRSESFQPLNALVGGHRQQRSNNVVRRPWGSYESMMCGEGYQVKRIVVAPGKKLSLQYHQHRSEHWTVVEGEVYVTIGDDVMVLQCDESIYVPLGSVHRLDNRGQEDVVLIEVQCGNYLGEDDIVRIEDDFGRA
jgi:mannose-6-phosphate isomerase-like protein (cupin superfamily)